MKQAWLNGTVGLLAATLVTAPVAAQQPVPTFRSSVKLLLLRVATTMSRSPSRSTSPAASELGLVPPAP